LIGASIFCPLENTTRTLFPGSKGSRGVIEVKKLLWYLERELKSRNL
jgi:hypothetical protein